MIVSESDVLAAALDRRLQVDRVLPPAAASARGSDGARADPQQPGAVARPGAIAQQFPPGQQVDGRVAGVAVGQPGQVIVEFGALRLALGWPGALPAVGDRIALRVLANTPSLLFEHVVLDEDAPADAPPRLSAAARALQGTQATTVARFSAPILKIEIEGGTVAAESFAADAPATARTATVERPPDSGMVVPLVLHGPAWPGQDVELVVHRDREDDAFDNAALDRWCGELVIDLPNLGRVAGHLAWSMQGLRIRLEGRDAASVTAMSATAPELARALAEVDLPVLALSVGRPRADNDGGDLR